MTLIHENTIDNVTMNDNNDCCDNTPDDLLVNKYLQSNLKNVDYKSEVSNNDMEDIVCEKNIDDELESEDETSHLLIERKHEQNTTKESNLDLG